jgi:hypothetical protein
MTDKVEELRKFMDYFKGTGITRFENPAARQEGTQATSAGIVAVGLLATCSSVIRYNGSLVTTAWRVLRLRMEETNCR